MAILHEKVRYKPGFRLAQVAFCLAVAVVVLGAFTRLVDAGLGCPDWPGCYGHLTWPAGDEAIARAEERFPDTAVDTSKTWPEMVHRYAAGGLGVLIALIALRAWSMRDRPDYPFRLPVFLLFVVVWQALFGMWTVTLKLWPQVVALHLMGGMTVLSLLWLLVNRLGNVRWQLVPSMAARIARLRPWIVVGIVLVAGQILLGGWTTANYAAFGCPDFPTCHGRWWPEMDLARGFDVFQTIGPNYLGGQLENDARVAIHFVHRLGALVVTAYLLFLAVRCLTIPHSRLRAVTAAMLGALVLQVTLGVANVLLQVPLWLAVAHNAGAGLLILTLVTLGSRVWMAETEESREQ